MLLKFNRTVLKLFRLVGHANVRCTDDGTWSFPTPECTPQSCDPPANISNGYFEGDRHSLNYQI